MRIPKRLLIVILLSVLTVLSGCSQQGSEWQGEMSQAATEEKYSLLYIYDSSIPEGSRNIEGFRTASLEMPEIFTFLVADYHTDKESLDVYLDTLMPISLPLAVVAAPNGAITGSYHEPCSIADLRASVVSTKESEILLTLQNGRIAILCAYAGDLEAFKYTEFELSEFSTYGIYNIDIHYLNPASAEDKEYLGKMALPIDKSVIYIMVPSGVIIAKYPLDAFNVVDTIDLIMNNGGGDSI